MLGVFFAMPVSANEICKEALNRFRIPSEIGEKDRKEILNACKGSHGADDALIAKLLKRCDKLPGAAKDNCKLDVYRSFTWFEK